MFDRIQKQAESAVRELLEVSKLRPGDLLVIGCSSSEIMGERIGKGCRGSCWRCSAAST